MSLALVQSFVADCMDKISRKFKPGVCITVIVRSPGFPERDFMMTDDRLDEIEAVIARRRSGAKRTAEGLA